MWNTEVCVKTLCQIIWILMYLYRLMLLLDFRPSSKYWNHFTETKIFRNSFCTDCFLTFNQIMWLVPCKILTLIFLECKWLSSCDFLLLPFLHCMWPTLCGIPFLVILHSMQLVPRGILFMSFLWCMWLACVETFFCYCHITFGLYLCWILLQLHVAGALRSLVFAVFEVHMILTLQKSSAFYSMHEDSVMQNPYSAIFILHVACTWRNPSIAAFHCMYFAHCEIMLSLVKHCMMLTLISLQNPCSAVLTLHAAHTLRIFVSAVFI